MRRKKGKIVSPFQDYQNGTLYYGYVVGDAIYCVTSKRTIHNWASIQAPTRIDWDPQYLRDTLRRQGCSRPAIVGFLKGTRTVVPLDLYDRLRQHLTTYVRFKNDDDARFLALWTMGTYVYRIFHAYPYVWLRGSFRAGGKHTLMKLLEPIAFNAHWVMDWVGEHPVANVQIAPTLLMDQMLTLSRGSGREEVARRRVFETGGHAAGAVSRHGCLIRTYCPKIFAGLAEVPRRIAQRSIALEMSVRGDGDIKKYYDDTESPTREERALKDDLYLFGWTQAAAIAKTYAAMTKTGGSPLWHPIRTLIHALDPEKRRSDWAGLRAGRKRTKGVYHHGSPAHD